MSSALQAVVVRPRPTLLSVEDYHRWEGYDNGDRRTELLRGVIEDKPMPSPRHNIVVRRLFWLAEAAAGPGVLVRKEESMTLVDSEPQPDLAIVRGLEDDFARAHPTTAELVIEVSITSEKRDRTKLSLYAEAEIPEYWLVLPEEKSIEVHASPLAGHYTETHIHSVGETVVPATLPGLRVAVGELFRG